MKVARVLKRPGRTLGQSSVTVQGRDGTVLTKRDPVPARETELPLVTPGLLPTTVVIPSPCQNATRLQACLRHLPPEVEVILVRTALHEGQGDVRVPSRPGLSVVDLSAQPFCFAAALNAGVQHAHGDWLVLLNDDVAFRSAADFWRLAQCLHHPGAGLVAPLATYSGVTEQRARSARGGRLLEVPMVPAIAWAVRRRVYTALGGLDEQFRGYGLDDDDFCWRLRAKHFRLFVCPEVLVDHEGHATFGRDWEHIRKEIARWSKVFARKHRRTPAQARQADLAPALAVVIPCYNAAPWIHDTLDSVLALTDLPDAPEIVCVDDGSTDDTWAQLRTLKMGLGDQLLLYGNTTRQGPSQARNQGVLRATAQNIMFLDADDLTPPARGAQHLAMLADFDMVYGQLASFHEQTGLPRGRLQSMSGIDPPAAERLLGGNGYRIGTAAARRTVFEQEGCWLDEGLLGLEDWEWFLTCVGAGLRVGCSPDVWLWRRVVEQSHRQRIDIRALRQIVEAKHRVLLDHAAKERALPQCRLEEPRGGPAYW